MENKLKNWSLNTRRAEWKAERKLVSIEAERKKNIITNEAEARISAIKENAAATCRNIHEEAERKKAEVERWKNDEIVRIAKAQDDYEMEFREYVAGLPEGLRQASVMLERGANQ